MKFFENEKNENKILVVMSVITFLINICFIAESKMIYMSEDEFGPIAIAAYFCGQDWTSVLQNTAYYSYGYSLILTPLFWLTNSAESFYRAAIVLNALFTAAIVPVSYYIGKRICFYTKKINLFLVSFAVANFVVNVGRSQSAWCETLLTFLFWCLILNFVKLEEHINFKRVLFGAIALSFTYMVHQRTIGIFISGIICFFALCIIKKYKKKYLFCYSATIIILMAVHSGVKQFVQTNIWLNSSTLQGNDYGGRFQQIASRGILNLLKMAIYTVSGHIYYIAVATLGVGVFAVFLLVKKMIAKEQMVYVFIGLSVAATFGISILGITPSSWGEWGSSSYLIYGRYIEIFLGILIYMALMFFLENQKDKISLIITMTVVILTAFFTIFGWKNISELWFNNHCCIGLNVFYNDGNMNFWIPLALVFICLLVLHCCNNEFEKMVYIGAISVFWIIAGIIYLEDPLYVEKSKYKLMALIEEKEKRNKNCDFYFYNQNTTYNDTFMQFLMKDKESLLYQSDYTVIPDEIFYGVTDDSVFFEVNKDMNIIAETGGVYLFTNDQTAM